jgi:outer membrane lipoprotein LolB
MQSRTTNNINIDFPHADIDDWQLKGRFGARNGNDAWNGSVQWRQHGDDSKIALSGPLGQGNVLIQSNPYESQLQIADNGVFFSDNVELLIFRHTGMHLPVKGLRHWVLGLPSPLYPVQSAELDEQNRLLAIQQHDWKIQFKRYRKSGAFELPAKLYLDHPDFEVRLIIDRWQVES